MCTIVGGRGGGFAFHGGVGSFYLRICRGGGVNCTSGPPYLPLQKEGAQRVLAILKSGGGGHKNI